MTAASSQLFDPGLQPERTALAWRRTALALCVGSLLAVRILGIALGTWAMIPAGAGVLAAVGVLVAAHHRHKRTVRVLLNPGGDPPALPAGVLPFAVTVIAVAGGVAALAVVLATR